MLKASSEDLYWQEELESCPNQIRGTIVQFIQCQLIQVVLEFILMSMFIDLEITGTTNLMSSNGGKYR